MAYDFFPKTVAELEKQTRSGYTPEVRQEYAALFTHLRNKYPQVETPINLDKQKRKSCNVTRQLQEDTTIQELKRVVGIKQLSMKFGNGSSGNRGAANRGNLFEVQFNKALNDWWAGENIADANMKKAIEHLDKTYKLRNAEELKIEIVGGENTPRPLQYDSNGVYLKNTKGTGNDVGANVTDITLTRTEKRKKEEIYLSLKVGTTVTFFNVGVRRVLTPDEIKANNITNKNGLELLDVFGIDPLIFCMVFNGELTGGIKKTNTVNKEKLHRLLLSGIGHGYHVIHKMSGKIISEKMDKRTLDQASRVGSSIVHYGGKTGTGKRIDVEVESGLFKFKLNIRDTQGRDGYPTRLMCDFTHK